MSIKSLVILVLVTAALVAGAVFLRPGAGPGPDPLPEVVIEGLDVNAVHAVRIERANASLSLRRDAAGAWAVSELGEYPARVEDIKQLLLSIARLEPLERKTAREDRYATLGVEGPTTGSESVRVTLLQADGGDLASVVVGDSSFLGSEQGTYVRVGAQAWLIRGSISAPDDPLRWADRAVLRVGPERVRRIRAEHPDGEVVELVRTGDGADAPFTVDAPPAGREPLDDAQLAGFASTLSYVGMENARAGTDPAAAPPADAVRTEYTLDDGSRVLVRTWEQDATFWAVFTAEPAPEQPEPEQPAPEQPEPEQPEPEQPAPDEPVLPSAPDLLGGRSSWAFALAASKAERLRPRIADVTTEASAEEFLGPLEQPETPTPTPTEPKSPPDSTTPGQAPPD